MKIERNKRCREVVINKCYGGFGLSHQATKMYWEAHGKRVRAYSYDLTTKTKTYLTEEEIGNNLFVHYDNADDEDESITHEIPRDDPILVDIVKRLGSKADGPHAELGIVEIPADVDWYIEEYDGNEHIAEKHRTWR